MTSIFDSARAPIADAAAHRPGLVGSRMPVDGAAMALTSC